VGFIEEETTKLYMASSGWVGKSKKEGREEGREGRKEGGRAEKYLRGLHGRGDDIVVLGLFAVGGEVGVEPLQNLLQDHGA